MKTLCTKSERLFWAYLNNHDYTGIVYEPDLPACVVHPDFLVPFQGTPTFFEVKEHNTVLPDESYSSDLSTFSEVDPYHPFRAAINKAARQFQGARDYPCSLVFYNIDNSPTLNRPEFVFGAMLGNLCHEFRFSWDGTIVAGSEKTVFGSGGKMVHRGYPCNTTISSIVVLEEIAIPDPSFQDALNSAIAKAERGLARNLGESEYTELYDRQLNKYQSRSSKHVRVIVVDNPRARIPPPTGIFRGPLDERWALINGRLHESHRGSALPPDTQEAVLDVLHDCK